MPYEAPGLAAAPERGSALAQALDAAWGPPAAEPELAPRRA